jgi:hypothetical protein
MKKLWLCATAKSFFVALATAAHARSAYDGSWGVAFVTQRGVTEPNLVKFRGCVAKSGAARASVTVQDKHASGSGRLSGTSGRGTWSGRSDSRDARAIGRRNAIENA